MVQVHHVDFHEDADDLTLGRDAAQTGDPKWAPDSNLSIAIENVSSDSTSPDARVDSVCRYKRAVREAIPTVHTWLSRPSADGEIPTSISTADAPNDVIFFVSAGFDAMMDDGFGTQHLDAAWYRWFVVILRKNFPHIPMVFNLEGGYNSTNVINGVESVLEALSIPQGSAEWKRDYYT